MRVLVTGSTGYIGSRLVPALLDRGHDVVAAMRDTDKKKQFDWGDRVDTVYFDLGDPDTAVSATRGVDAVVYLVHSMDAGDFVRKDREAAQALADAAEQNGVQRIVYLSGLVPDDGGELSDHIKSRLQVEDVFLASSVDATALRAAIIIGSGSTSFELVRRLSERLPVLPIPTWLRRDVQPISVDDVIAIIARAIEPTTAPGSYDIGGTQSLSYPELLRTFADVADLRRPHVVVPLLPTGLVGRVVAAITQMPHGTVVSLTESLQHDMVVRRGNAATGEFAESGTELTSLKDALRRSITVRNDEGTEHGADPLAAADTDPGWAGGVVSIEDGVTRRRPTGIVSRVLLGPQ